MKYLNRRLQKEKKSYMKCYNFYKSTVTCSVTSHLKPTTKSAKLYLR